MRQTKLESLQEAGVNTAIAFCVSVLTYRYLIAPLIEKYVDTGGNIDDWFVGIFSTLFYTIVSFIRNFLIRIFFERKLRKKHEGKKVG